MGTSAQDLISETKKVRHDIPLISINNEEKIRPLGRSPVTADLVKGDRPLPEYTHPNRALYIFGAEDSSPDKEIHNWRNGVIYTPTES